MAIRVSPPLLLSLASIAALGLAVACGSTPKMPSGPPPEYEEPPPPSWMKTGTPPAAPTAGDAGAPADVPGS